MAEASGRILVFARAPVAGQAKTRLHAVLSPDAAAELHARLTRQTLAMLVGGFAVELWCTPDSSHAFFHRCADEFGVVLRDQKGSNLGARLAHACATVLMAAPWVVAVGTDCPELGPQDISDAVVRLTRGADAVLGPAADGGYYLIGLRRSAAVLFEDIPWGGPDVMQVTRERLHTLGWRWEELRVLHDLDRPEDLDYFAGRFAT